MSSEPKTDIRFYHLTRQPLQQALPSLVEKIHGIGHRLVVRLPDKAAVKAMNEALWTHNPKSFIPHGGPQDPAPERQPVYLTDENVNPGGAKVLLQAEGTDWDAPQDFEIFCLMFSGHREDIVQAARAKWKLWKDAGYTLSYYQQNERGGWDLKQRQDPENSA